jgi:hypothetical protein
MRVRRGLLWIALVCLGCHTLPALEEGNRTPAGQFWELGQKAMQQGQPDEAIRCYQQSLAADPNLRRNHLSLAAAYLDKKDERRACAHLAEYVEAYPENLTVRFRYAELLAGLHRIKEASDQFEAFLADIQDLPGPADKSLISSHTRLVELAEAGEDAYTEHLHRGIGLFLLAGKRTAFDYAAGELPSEGLLCKSAAELTLAHLERPDEARPCWYLYLVWSQLGQRQPALCRLREADAASPFTYLTAAEQRNLQLACQSCRVELQR